jgi:hypothetical protein
MPLNPRCVACVLVLSAALMGGALAIPALGNETAGWTYDGAPNRSGNSVVPSFTWECAKNSSR